MSIRKSSTEKVKKEKAPKVKKEKKSKKSKGTDDSASLDAFAAPAPKKVKVKKPAVKAPKDVYTLVLLLSFLFFIAATVFLFLDLSTYK